MLSFLASSCMQQTKTIDSDFSGQLTEEEISNGVMTPEIMWKFGRLGDAQLSPDGLGVIYNVTRYDSKTNKSITDIFWISTEGGDPIQLTNGSGKYYNPRWNPVDPKIGFLSAESGSTQIWQMNLDGSGRTQISEFENGINSFEYSPDGTHIMFTSDVKLDRIPVEMYPDLPLATVRIIVDLMYRHWNDWHDYAYSHIFVAPCEKEQIGDATDIMKDEPWDSPLSPIFD